MAVTVIPQDVLAEICQRVDQNKVAMASIARELALPYHRVRSAVRAYREGRAMSINGRPSVVTDAVLAAVKARLDELSREGSAISEDELKTLLVQCVNRLDGGDLQQITKTTYKRVRKRLTAMGVKFGRGLSTSEARMRARSVEHLSGFYNTLKSILEKYPELSELGRLVALDESPAHQQTEKLKLKQTLVFVPDAMVGRKPRVTVLGDGSREATQHPPLSCLCQQRGGPRTPQPHSLATLSQSPGQGDPPLC